ncbi:uncharacterized protein LOC131245417 [Magnolia sinica]|uniref:uncharacterized protein LOC131245417 n=1 Tax=Magnolia sinica TaxID=86752 RepID=UPI00265B1A0A|nr:uncharacterized protein LOC131245417 [Magnolia sinica]
MDHQIQDRQEIRHSSTNPGASGTVTGQQEISHNSTNPGASDTVTGRQEISHNSTNPGASDTVTGRQEISYNSTNPGASDTVKGQQEIGHNSTNPGVSDTVTGRQEISHNLTNPGVSDTVTGRQEISHNLTNPGASHTATGADLSDPVASENVIEVRSAAKFDVLEVSKVTAGQELKANVSEQKRDTCIAIDVRCGSGGLDSGNWDGEKVCRICHLSSDRRSDGSDLIQLGCGCKDELGISHRHCAETWFKLKGNRSCEICGEAAKNVTGVGDNRFMEEWNERRRLRIGTSSSSERGRCWRVQPFCNFLMACLVIAFILPWFFRVNMF